MDLPKLELPPLECPAVLLPTPADLTNLFGSLATFPAKLRVLAVTTAKEEATKLLEQAKQIQDIIDGIRKFFAAYDPDWKKISFPEKEWEIMVQRLIEEFPMYVQAQIIKLITSIIPISINLSLMGLTIDVIKLVTDRNYLSELLSTLKGETIDKLYEIIDDAYKLFSGEFGLENLELKAKQIADYIKNEATKFMNNALFGVFTALLKKFKIIWDALGLDALVALVTMDVGALIKGIIDEKKAEYASALAALGDNPLQSAKDKLKVLLNDGIASGLEDLELFGFKVKSLLGGVFTDTTETIEATIARITAKIKEFVENWQSFLFKTWMQKITSFLKAIGLGTLVSWLTFDFCDFLKVLGIWPIDLDLSSFSNISSVATDFTSGLPTLSVADNPVDTFTEEIMEAGQTVIEGSFIADHVTVVNKSNLESAFTGFSISSGNVVLNEAATAGTEYLIIPDPEV